MLIIAFSTNTSKIIPRILCRQFRHVAVITPHDGGNLTMHQFIRLGNVVNIKLHPRDLIILGRNGWRFIYMDGARITPVDARKCATCVIYAKRALDIRRIRIQTPDALYKYLTK